MLRAPVHLELRDEATRQAVLREHALDRLADHPIRYRLADLPRGLRLQPDRVARVVVVALLVELATRELHLARVENDDEVAGVDMGGEARLVFSAQHVRDPGRETPELELGGVDHEPRSI